MGLIGCGGGAVYTGRGPVCGRMTRFAGGSGALGLAAMG